MSARAAPHDLNPGIGRGAAIVRPAARKRIASVVQVLVLFGPPSFVVPDGFAEAVIAATVPNTRSTGVVYGRRINFRPLSGSFDVGG
jgi:hypothetical protein